MRILGDTLGDRLTNLRTADGHSLRWIAEQVGISNPYLSQLESGKIVSPGSDVLACLARYYGVTMDALWYGADK